MAAITQPRGSFPFTGRRYGLLTASGDNPMAAPDFMRGSLRAVPYLAGDIRIVPAVIGEIAVSNALAGKVDTNP